MIRYRYRYRNRAPTILRLFFSREKMSKTSPWKWPGHRSRTLVQRDDAEKGNVAGPQMELTTEEPENMGKYVTIHGKMM